MLQINTISAEELKKEDEIIEYEKNLRDHYHYHYSNENENLSILNEDMSDLVDRQENDKAIHDTNSERLLAIEEQLLHGNLQEDIVKKLLNEKDDLLEENDYLKVSMNKRQPEIDSYEKYLKYQLSKVEYLEKKSALMDKRKI